MKDSEAKKDPSQPWELSQLQQEIYSTDLPFGGC